MAREERRILFDYAEVYKAVYTLCVHKEANVPPAGRISAITVRETGAERAISLKIMNANTEAAFKCDYTVDFVAAALIMYCRTCGIPLPRRGVKTVEIDEKAIVLRVVIHPSGANG